MVLPREFFETILKISADDNKMVKNYQACSVFLKIMPMKKFPLSISDHGLPVIQFYNLGGLVCHSHMSNALRNGSSMCHICGKLFENAEHTICPEVKITLTQKHNVTLRHSKMYSHEKSYVC